MSGEIVMPKLGLTMEEGIVSDWNVQVGSQVKAGDVLFSVETEKIVTDIEARADGEITSIDVPAGETVAVGAVIATWSGPSMALDHSTDAPDALHEQATPAAPIEDETSEAVEAKSSRIVASPSARRKAKQLGLDLPSITGTGPRGRITLADVEAATAPVDAVSAPAGDERTSRSATRFEKIVARRLVQSKQTIPHFYVQAWADVTALLEHRKTMNAAARDGLRLTINDFVILATARALASMPALNVVWEEDQIVSLPTIDVGMAVDTELGLFVPILRDLAKADIRDVAAAARQAAGKARAGQLQPNEMEGGAISISNVGMAGAVTLIPIINPGQSAILGVGAIESVFRPDDDEAPVLRRELGLAMACDHRVHDGVRAAKLLSHLCGLLTDPAGLVGT